MFYSQVLKDPSVIFAGYKVPHPLEHKFVLRIQTNGECTPQDVLLNAISDLMSELNLFEERFRVSIKFVILFIYLSVYHPLRYCIGCITRKTRRFRLNQWIDKDASKNNSI